MHSPLRRAEAPVGYERATAGSVPGRGFASEATERGGRRRGWRRGGEERKKREEGTISGEIVPVCLVPRPSSFPISFLPPFPAPPPLLTLAN